MLYIINGWEESKSYFLSFGFTEEELQEMENGGVIKRDGNTFWIVSG